MSQRVISQALMTAAVVLIAACGGGSKKGPTTPTAPAATSPSMNDKDPNGTGATDGNPGAGSPGDTTGTPADSAPGAEPSPLAITPPNLDPDPQQARAEVEDHLKIARRALAQPTPDAETAMREARLALSIDAANVDAAAMVALAYYHKRLYDTAELVLDDVFRREAAKNNANVFYTFGLIYDKTNRGPNAAKAFEQAVAADGNHISALTNLGVYQLRNKQYVETGRTFEKLVQQFGRKDAITLTSLGSAYRGQAASYPPGGERNGLTSKAENSYKQALTTNSNYGPAYYNLALLYLDSDPFPSAGGSLDTLVRLNQAKTYFDSYKAAGSPDLKLYDERMKDVSKAVKREEKRRKKSSAPATP
jgi:tetratricopeptide (TPR) repeat protein